VLRSQASWNGCHPGATGRRIPDDTTRDKQGRRLALHRIDAILARGTLRVAYLPDSLPFACRNEEGEAVGYDIDLVQTLAGEHGLRLEIARMSWPEIVDALEKGQIDLAVGGIGITPRRATETGFSDPLH
jgi:ABC-type amino acid transport substrate-binding protein